MTFSAEDLADIEITIMGYNLVMCKRLVIPIVDLTAA